MTFSARSFSVMQANAARELSGAQLAAALRESRARTWAWVTDLTPAQWSPALAPGINPIAWELAHLAWFAEFWMLRGPHAVAADGITTAHRAPSFAGPDALFDSARLPHAARWTEPMPSPAQLHGMLHAQLESCIATLPNGDGDDAGTDETLYFPRLALFHEDMHGEALCWMRAALSYPAPAGVTVPQVPASVPMRITGGEVQLGRPTKQTGFAFDNELPGTHTVLPDFEIDSAPVAALAFARFVDAGGYDQARYWPGEAGSWRANSGVNHPSQWRRGAHGGWQMRWFDQWLTLAPGLPALHLNAFEAEAYCRWAGCRLPTAAEWEHAATTQTGAPIDARPDFHWGRSVWEWTSTPFAPYPGFVAGPYQEYSRPWFGDHRELRGGAFATHSRLHHPQYRNFFMPYRSDIFAGFRTVAL